MARCARHRDTPDITCPTCHAARRITELASQGKFELAPRLMIDVYDAEVMRVLEVLGFPEALVTDESTIGDFRLDDRELTAASRMLGVAVRANDYVYEVAKKLRESRG